jgi:hypothetical protein
LSSTHDPVATSHVVPFGHDPHGLELGLQLAEVGAHRDAVVPSLVTSCVQLSPEPQSASLAHVAAHASSPPICAHAPRTQSELFTHGVHVAVGVRATSPSPSPVAPSPSPSSPCVDSTMTCGQPARTVAAKRARRFAAIKRIVPPAGTTSTEVSADLASSFCLNRDDFCCDDDGIVTRRILLPHD